MLDFFVENWSKVLIAVLIFYVTQIISISGVYFLYVERIKKILNIRSRANLNHYERVLNLGSTLESLGSKLITR